MAFYRRRYRKRSSFRRRGYGARKSRTLKKVKRDILKCNFPTKVKFIGLPEKKTMFLTDQQTIVTSGNNQNKVLYLYPTACENFKTLYRDEELFPNNNSINSILANWDKYCVLAVYIRIQPNANIFDGSDGKKIVPIKCYYAMNNNLDYGYGKDDVNGGDDQEVDEDATVNGHLMSEVLDEYGKRLLIDKPIFTFNSNEHCTFVLKSPQTMQSDTPVVHSKYQWWSIVDQAILTRGEYRFSGSRDQQVEDDGDDGSDKEGELCPLGTPITPLRPMNLPAVHCGHLYFDSGNTEVSLNITINYKIALRG